MRRCKRCRERAVKSVNLHGQKFGLCERCFVEVVDLISETPSPRKPSVDPATWDPPLRTITRGA
jgi:hypothetical protein